MHIKQLCLRDSRLLADQLPALAAIDPQLLLVFAAPDFFADASNSTRLQTALPGCVLLGCSTAGEISSQGVEDHALVLTAIRFSHTRVQAATTLLHDMADSRAAGARLARQLDTNALQLVLVLGQGVAINGSAMLEGMRSVLGSHLPIVGGLAADDAAFRRTFTLGPQGSSDHALVAVGLSGQQLRLGHGSFGGWSTFGPVRKVTRCHDNILYELDGAPALEVYKRYLGEYAADLPGSGLLFPFSMLGDDLQETGIIRTIMGVDEEQGSITLASELETGCHLKLMHASTNSLVQGAEAAASAACQPQDASGDSLAILVSCVGRKLVMGDRVDEEIEAVTDALGSATVLAGFYSNGEISPFAPGQPSRLHNQTMTITTLFETGESADCTAHSLQAQATGTSCKTF
ncbi:MAG: FIST C-terminal domain-containing protein [Aquitalea sp.]|nr:FIST C-terminal domain-containing protein [Aquitalea sp.]